MVSLLCILSSLAFSDVEYSGITFSNIDIHGQGTDAIVKPGETIGIRLHYELTSPQKQGLIVQIYFGLDDTDFETSIASGVAIGGQYLDLLPLLFSKTHLDITGQDVDFYLIAPSEPGIYQARFRVSQAYLPVEDDVESDVESDLSLGDDATICTTAVGVCTITVR